MSDNVLKLWLLRPAPEMNDLAACLDRRSPWAAGYDVANGFVVRATTEDLARRCADANAGDENTSDTGPAHPWLEPKYSTCVELTVDGEPGVVMKDYWPS